MRHHPLLIDLKLLAVVGVVIGSAVVLGWPWVLERAYNERTAYPAGYSEKKFALVTVGMTTEEVARLVGEPFSKVQSLDPTGRISDSSVEKTPESVVRLEFSRPLDMVNRTYKVRNIFLDSRDKVVRVEKYTAFD